MSSARALTDRTNKLWSGGDLDVPLIVMKDPSKKALMIFPLNISKRYKYRNITIGNP